MCLGEIVQLVEVAGERAVGRRGETVVSLSLITLDGAVAPGDWVISHSGFALERISAQDAAEALAVRQQSFDPTPRPEEQP